MKINKLKYKAFTLIETIIYIAILGALLSYFVSFTLTISNSHSKTYVAQEVNSNARIALNMIASKIRSADDVNSPSSSNISDSLDLNMPTPDADIVFSLENGVLKLAQDTSTSSITSDEVEVKNLIFTNLAPSNERDNISIFLTIAYRDDDSKEYEYSKSFQTSVSLRK